MSQSDFAISPGGYDHDVERLSEDLKRQVEQAKERISDRYGKLMKSGRQETGRRSGSDPTARRG